MNREAEARADSRSPVAPTAPAASAASTSKPVDGPVDHAVRDGVDVADGGDLLASRASTRDWVSLAVLALPCMVYAMDLTVLNLALPRISRQRPSGPASSAFATGPRPASRKPASRPSATRSSAMRPASPSES